MKSTDLRAKARAIFGPAIAEPMPKQPNGAKALQERANARPIPTYKVGGVVKKADGGAMKPKLSTAERKMGDALMMTRKGKEVMAAQKRMEEDKEKAMAAKRAKADKLLGITAKKDGGKVQTSSDTARKLAKEMGGMKKGGKAKDGLAVMIAVGKPVKKFMGGSMKARKMLDKLAPEARARMDASAGTVPAERPRGMIAKAMSNPKMAAAMEAARSRMDASAKTVPAERPRGMIAKGYEESDMRAKLEAAAEKAGVPVKRAVGGAGKTRKGQAPIKKAQGGAAKVRKGMMSESGDMLQPVKPKSGLGDTY